METQNTTNTTEAAVVIDVPGKTVVGAQALSLPTPEWVRKIVRAMTWVTAFYGMILLSVDLNDFGVSERMQFLILKYAASLTGIVSVIARVTGVQVPDLNSPQFRK